MTASDPGLLAQLPLDQYVIQDITFEAVDTNVRVYHGLHAEDPLDLVYWVVRADQPVNIYDVHRWAGSARDRDYLDLRASAPAQVTIVIAVRRPR